MWCPYMITTFMSKVRFNLYNNYTKIIQLLLTTYRIKFARIIIFNFYYSLDGIHHRRAQPPISGAARDYLAHSSNSPAHSFTFSTIGYQNLNCIRYLFYLDKKLYSKIPTQ